MCSWKEKNSKIAREVSGQIILRSDRLNGIGSFFLRLATERMRVGGGGGGEVTVNYQDISLV